MRDISSGEKGAKSIYAGFLRKCQPGLYILRYYCAFRSLPHRPPTQTFLLNATQLSTFTPQAKNGYSADILSHNDHSGSRDIRSQITNKLHLLPRNRPNMATITSQLHSLPPDTPVFWELCDCKVRRTDMSESTADCFNTMQW